MASTKRDSPAPSERVTRKVSTEEVRRLEASMRVELGEVERVVLELEQARTTIRHLDMKNTELEQRLQKATQALHVKYKELGDLVGQRKALRLELRRLKADVAEAFARVDALLSNGDPFFDRTKLPR